MTQNKTKNLENKWFYTTGLTAVVTITTLFLRLPTPTGGYFNFGDVAVVFCGLLLGKLGGSIAGGFGSAIADIVSGYALFSPITLVAKGLEGFLYGIAGTKKRIWSYVISGMGSASIVIIYFLGESILPQVGFTAAIAEIPANSIQAIGGFVGGRLLFEAYYKMISVEE